MGRSLGETFARPLPIIAVMHLPPLPGCQGFPGMEAVIENALRQLEAIEAVGMDGVLVENEYDLPHQFEPGPECVAAMAVVTSAVARQACIPVGAEILSHHPHGSLAVVKATGGRFIRTDFFVDRMRTESGHAVEPDPQEMLEYRAAIGGEGIAIWTDIQVKYATMLEDKPIRESARQADAAGSDGVVVTGAASGVRPTLDDLVEAKNGTSLPVIIGSGLDEENAAELLALADAALVGTSIKTGVTIDRVKAERLMAVVGKLRSGRGVG